MAKNQLALDRYKVILRILSRGGYYASKDLHIFCVNCGIDVKYRTVQKDLQKLREGISLFGKDLNIDFDEKSKKWYSDRIPKEIFGLLQLEKEEISALLFYAKTNRQYRDYPIFKEMSRAINKVIDSSNISRNIKELFENENLLDAEKHLPIKGIELIVDILNAIHNRKILIIEYQKFDNDVVKTHEIKPVVLKEDKQMWYIIGENTKYNSFMTLALDRIKSLNILEEIFEPIEFNPYEYFKYSFGVTVSDKPPIDVIISFTPYQGNYVRTLPIHSSQKILLDNDEEFRIQVTVIPSYEFYSKIKSYGEQATIISPPSLSQEIKKSLIRALENYN